MESGRSAPPRLNHCLRFGPRPLQNQTGAILSGLQNAFRLAPLDLVPALLDCGLELDILEVIPLGPRGHGE